MHRKISATYKMREVLEGAGVHLRRGFSNIETAQFDPFLLFDDFSSTIPEHYQAGFPWHPHRGIETVTYILDGAVRHRDSLGNEGVIESGAVQWMTSGKGIIHEEMPESVHGIRGFQLWVNLPKKDKLAPPKYQDLTGKSIPEVSVAPGAQARVIAGTIQGVEGPLKAVSGNPLYLDVSLEANRTLSFPVETGHTVFVYIIEGALGVPGDPLYAPSTILLFDREGEVLSLDAGASGARFLLVAGKPLGEPIAWHGPIVMNTEEELREAFASLQAGTFLS